MAFYSNTLAIVRQYLSSAVGDLITGTADSGTSTTLVDTMLRKDDDWYNRKGCECYIYEGTNIGEAREVADWQRGINTLTLDPAFTSAIVNSSKYELHYMFTEDDYRKAINLSIESLSKRYLVDISDTTTVRLTSTEDNISNTVFTWEYTLPTNMIYLHKVVTEEAVNGIKLTGTVSGDFTSGETITGGTSGATGELSYGVSGGTYIRVRKVDGTFVTGETATGGSSNETCSTITEVKSEAAGGGRWLAKDVIDTRNYSFIKSFSAKIKLNEQYYTINEDLYLRLEGQGAQPIVSSDTDIIYLPPDWIVKKAITFLPYNKILTNTLQNVFEAARVSSFDEPVSLPNPFAEQITE